VALLPGTAAHAVADAATDALESAGIEVRGIISEELIRAAQSGHIRILISALGFVAAIMSLVGVLGHASMLSTVRRAGPSVKLSRRLERRAQPDAARLDAHRIALQHGADPGSEIGLGLRRRLVFP
jgi:hypothetical protein